MGQILLINPSDEIKGFGFEASEKIKAMFGLTIPVSTVPAISIGAGLIEAGDCEVIFAPEPIATESISIFFGAFERAKKKPIIITTTDNYNKLKIEISDNYLIKNKDSFTKEYIFTVVRNLMTPPNQKLDIRYIQSILNSVISVVQENTQLELIADKILEQKAPEKPEDVLSIVGFYGDGFLGSLSFSTSQTVFKKMASKMLFCEESDLTKEMLLDVAGELGNQILGVVRTELAEFGYSLKNSFLAVIEGDQFITSNSSNGRYYILPFKLDGDSFNVSLCYNTYQTSIRAIESLQNTQNPSTFDIRVLEALDKSIYTVLKGNTGETPRRSDMGKHDQDEKNLQSFHVFHAAGWKAETTIGIEVPFDSYSYLIEKMIGIKPEDVEDSTVNDLMGEMMNQICGEYLKNLDKNLEFKLQRIYQGSYTKKEGINVITKLPGFGVRVIYELDGHKFLFVVSINSSHSEPIFNTWKYIESGEQFKDKLVVS